MQTFTLQRLLSNSKSTAGQMLSPFKSRMCSTVEDAYHAVKVHGQTRIPAGRYQIHVRAKGTSHFDARYGEIFHDIHQGMIELIGVPDYAGVLIHCGNTDQDTEGCIIVGDHIDIGPEGYQIAPGTSQPTYRKIYSELIAAIHAGETWLEVTDEPNRPNT